MTTEPEDDGFPVEILDEDAPRRRHPLVLAGVMVAIAVTAGLGGYMYSRFSSEEAPAEVPLVRAEPGPTKKRPAEPGGMEIPNQDKLVYGAVTGEPVDEKPERLLPPPEEPLPPPLPPASASQPAPAVQASPAQPPAPAPTPAPKAVAKAAPSAAEIPPPPQAATKAAKTAEAAKAVIEKAAGATSKAPAEKTVKKTVQKAAKKTVKKATATAAAAGGGYLVQLASFRSKAKADAAWAKYSKAHGDLLRGLKPLVTRVDLGADKGIYYRLRAGPLGGAAEARALCAKLKARKLGCLVVKK